MCAVWCWFLVWWCFVGCDFVAGVVLCYLRVWRDVCFSLFGFGFLLILVDWFAFAACCYKRELVVWWGVLVAGCCLLVWFGVLLLFDCFIYCCRVNSVDLLCLLCLRGFSVLWLYDLVVCL